MTGKQRILAALKGEMPDRRPVMLHNFMPAAKEAGYSMKQYREDPEIAAKCHLQFAEKYNLDGILFDVDTALTASTIGVPVDYPEHEPARIHETLLEDLSDIDTLPTGDISQHPRMQHAMETVRLLKKAVGEELLIRGNCDQAPFSLACLIRTPANFMMDLLLDEENAIKLLEYSTNIAKQVTNLMIEAGSDVVSNGESSAGPCMISPDMYDKFAKPYDMELIKTAQAQNIPYLLHICGDTTPIIQSMATMNLDAVELDYKTPIQDIYNLFGDKTTLFGNIDPSGVFFFGTPELVTEKATELLQLYKGNPRLVIGAGCALPPGTPEANIRALVKCAHEAPLY